MLRVLHAVREYLCVWNVKYHFNDYEFNDDESLVHDVKIHIIFNVIFIFLGWIVKEFSLLPFKLSIMLNLVSRLLNVV
jgi:hypothetical protein